MNELLTGTAPPVGGLITTLMHLASEDAVDARELVETVSPHLIASLPGTAPFRSAE
jgi:hypothetical protein